MTQEPCYDTGMNSNEVTATALSTFSSVEADTIVRDWDENITRLTEDEGGIFIPEVDDPADDLNEEDFAGLYHWLFGIEG